MRLRTNLRIVLGGAALAILMCAALAAAEPIVDGQDIPLEEAMAIAAKETGGARVVRSKTVNSRRGNVHIIDLLNSDYHYIYEINAADGDIIGYQKRDIVYYRPGREQEKGGAELAASAAVTLPRAREIALNAASGGEVMEVEVGMRSVPRLVYDFDILVGGKERELRVDATTGEIIRDNDKQERVREFFRRSQQQRRESGD